jgi:hypothetical protein
MPKVKLDDSKGMNILYLGSHKIVPHRWELVSKENLAYLQGQDYPILVEEGSEELEPETNMEGLSKKELVQLAVDLGIQLKNVDKLGRGKIMYMIRKAQEEIEKISGENVEEE